MRITESDVSLRAQHQYQQQRQHSERLDLVRINADGSQQRLSLEQRAGVSLSGEALALSRRVQTQDPALEQRVERGAARGRPLPPGLAKRLERPAGAQPLEQLSLDSKTRLLKTLVEQISGRRIELLEHRALTAEQGQLDPPADAAAAPRAPEGPRFGLRYERSEHYEESESLAFSAAARVTTADGRRIELNLELNMSRQFVSDQHSLLEIGAKLKDPLVINLDGGGTRLGEERIDFDIDADGSPDNIALVDAGSALLALDRNGDGVINDGSELFGALSGNGFADLARYDDDANGFIDEGDAIFADLRVWLRQDGENRLLALADQGVGALYLGYSDTPFALTDAHNQLEGVVRSSGLYLNQDGSGGTLQQIDLVV